MHPRAPRLRLVIVTLLALASLSALAAVHPSVTASTWQRGDDVALLAAWVVAIAASAWLFVATGACVLALGFARPQLAGRLAHVLPAGVRRLVEIAIVSSCVALPALPAHAAGPAPVVREAPIVLADRPVVRALGPKPAPATTPRTTSTTNASTTTTTSSPRSTGSIGTEPVAPAPVPAHRSPRVASPPGPSAPAPSPPDFPDHTVVRAGDNLWLIARAALLSSSRGRVDEHDILRYWLAVIAANRSTLRSGDPSLIFPGEIVSLPPPAAVS